MRASYFPPWRRSITRGTSCFQTRVDHRSLRVGLLSIYTTLHSKWFNARCNFGVLRLASSQGATSDFCHWRLQLRVLTMKSCGILIGACKCKQLRFPV